MKKTILIILNAIVCLLTVTSCDYEYFHEYQRDFRFEMENELISATQTGSFKDGYINHKLFETTTSRNYIVFSMPGVRSVQSVDFVVKYLLEEETYYAEINSMRFVFSLNHGKFIGDGREYTTSLGNFEVEVYAYDEPNGETFRYNYSVDVTNAAMKLDRFELKDGNCDKLICSGSFIIDSELLICDKDGNELARVPFNLKNGSFKCIPIP